MSQELLFEVRYRTALDQDRPSANELALIAAILPELIHIMHQLELDEQQG